MKNSYIYRPEKYVVVEFVDRGALSVKEGKTPVTGQGMVMDVRAITNAVNAYDVLIKGGEKHVFLDGQLHPIGYLAEMNMGVDLPLSDNATEHVKDQSLAQYINRVREITPTLLEQGQRMTSRERESVLRHLEAALEEVGLD